ncbi:hypothetical protein BG006_005794 [Podila minutissima]|uniref:RRM domain-containing protein n=1 Tax=Podila minutissima TaxID=64525 RepID=A0A9P5SS92_9FUNG|nr:hypothetical protein BG006_005794 [Podila minutissima]
MSDLKKRSRSSSVRQGVQAAAAAVKAAAMLPLDLEGIDSAILDKLENLLHKIESKLRSIEAPSLEKVDLTLRQLEETYATLEMPSIDDKVRTTLRIMEQTYHAALNAKSTIHDKLHTAVSILEEKYVELEQTSFERMDDAMGMLEKVDSRAFVDYAFDTLGAHRRAALAGAKRLLRFEELPEQWQENEYIFSGYRFLSSKTQCFKSIFYVHNESGNIWTHLLGFFYFLAVGIYFFSGSNPYLSTPNASPSKNLPYVPADGYDKLVFLVFFLAVYKCLLMSSLWHTFAQIAHEGTMKCMACLDYVGISVLIAASVVVTEYYGFYCETLFRNSYIIATAMFGVAGVVIPWLSWFDQKETRWLRITFFISMAASALLPVFHLIMIQGVGPTLEWITPLLKSMGSYLLGVFVYANQYPEKLFPGRFDHLGSSHQWWHLCVLGGVYFHFTAALTFWERRYEFGCPSGFEGIAPPGGFIPIVSKEIQRLNAREAGLSTSHSESGSWHAQYKDSAHIFVGGLPFHLTEGDILCVFSQCGEIVGINLVRDKDTGKSRGFCFIKYLDQRSTVLAVDNMNGSKVGGRSLTVDHVQNYKVPKKMDEDGNEVEQDEESINNAAPKPIEAPSESEEESSESEVDDTGIDIDDPMREYLLKKRKKELKKAAKKKSSESKAERKARKEAKKLAKKEKKSGKSDRKDDGDKDDKDVKKNADEIRGNSKESRTVSENIKKDPATEEKAPEKTTSTEATNPTESSQRSRSPHDRDRRSSNRSSTQAEKPTLAITVIQPRQEQEAGSGLSRQLQKALSVAQGPTP